MDKNKRPSWCKYGGMYVKCMNVKMGMGMNVKMRFKERLDKRFDIRIMKKSKKGKRITIKHRAKVVCILANSLGIAWSGKMNNV